MTEMRRRVPVSALAGNSPAMLAGHDAERRAWPPCREGPRFLATASGQAVATAYCPQPLLMADAFAVERSAIGLVGTATQVGYGAGLALVAPLGDVFPRRALIAGLLFLSAPALAAVALAPTDAILLLAMAAIGALAVVAQIMAGPGAAGRASAATRGKRSPSSRAGSSPASCSPARVSPGAFADLLGWRAVYAASAVAAVLMALLLGHILPRERRPNLVISYPRLVLSYHDVRGDPDPAGARGTRLPDLLLHHDPSDAARAPCLGGTFLAVANVDRVSRRGWRGGAPARGCRTLVRRRSCATCDGARACGHAGGVGCRGRRCSSRCRGWSSGSS